MRHFLLTLIMLCSIQLFATGKDKPGRYHLFYASPALTAYHDTAISLNSGYGLAIGYTTVWNFRHSWSLEMNIEASQARFRSEDNYKYPAGNYPDPFLPASLYDGKPQYDNFMVSYFGPGLNVYKRFRIKRTELLIGGGPEIRFCFDPGYNRTSDEMNSALLLIHGKNYYDLPSQYGISLIAGAEVPLGNSHYIRLALQGHIKAGTMAIAQSYSKSRSTSFWGLQISAPFSPENQAKRQHKRQNLAQIHKAGGNMDTIPYMGKNSIFVEIAGLSMLSLNYERHLYQFKNRISELRLRAGYANNFKLPSVHQDGFAGLAYIIGPNRLRGEAGTGAFYSSHDSETLGVFLVLGIRYECYNGLFLRANYSGKFNNSFPGHLPGFSLGYRW